MVSLISKHALSFIVAPVLFLGLSSAVGQANIPKPDRIRQAVAALQPALKLSQSLAIAGAIHTVSEEESCGIPWQILLSIAFQESSLKKSAIGRLNPHVKDYGLMQINEKNVLRLRLDRRRLLTDIVYSLRVGCGILVRNKEVYGSLPYWIGVYRSGTAIQKARTVKIAKAYHNLIMRRAAALGYEGDDE